jgi:hypothetical protein
MKTRLLGRGSSPLNTRLAGFKTVVSLVDALQTKEVSHPSVPGETQPQ